MASRLLNSGQEEVGIFHLVRFCQKDCEEESSLKQ